MKVTKTYLKHLIKEEISRLNEGDASNSLYYKNPTMAFDLLQKPTGLPQFKQEALEALKLRWSEFTEDSGQYWERNIPREEAFVKVYDKYHSNPERFSKSLEIVNSLGK
jgi:hypothetical protein